MRITFVLPGWSLRPNGGARVVYRYAHELVTMGHIVTVVHARLLEPWQVRPPLLWRREAKIVVRALADGLKRSPHLDWETIDPRVRLVYVRNLASREVPDGDIVVATAWRTAESVARYGPEKGVKHYLIQHYETWDGPVERVDQTWRLPLRRVVIAPWLEEVGRKLGVGVSLVVPNAIDLERFLICSPVDERPPRVAMMYSSAPFKGAEVGIRALELAREKIPSLQAVFFGLRPRPRGLPSWIDYVRDPDPSTLVEDIYNGSSVYLCPSFSEGWHLPPAEAMACGCAVVSTDIDGVSAYAVDGETARLAPPGDSHALSQAIVELISEPGERVRLARSARSRIEQFSWRRSAGRLERLFLDAVEGSSARQPSQPGGHEE